MLLNIILVQIITIIIVPYEITVDASPYIFTAKIRQIPCSSKKNNETGICMFAAECFKEHGKHLAMCIDGVFFGSCCKLPKKKYTSPSIISTTTHQSTTTTSKPIIHVTEKLSESTLNLINTNELDLLDTKNVTMSLTNQTIGFENTSTDVNLPQEIEDNLLDNVKSSTIKQLTTKSSINYSINEIQTTEPTNEIGISKIQITSNISTMLPKTTTEVITTKPEFSTIEIATASTQPEKNATYIEITTEFYIPDPFITTPSSPFTSVPTSKTTWPFDVTSNYDEKINMSNYKEVCGRRFNRRKRIVGGKISQYGDWPWQLSLMIYNRNIKSFLHKCGATLLNENWAITAAHCVQLDEPQNVMLRLGDYDLSNEDEPFSHESIQVQIIAIHQQFDRQTYEYDLALLRFNESIKFKPNIIPICIPETDDDFVGKTVYATGWGRLQENGPLPSIINQIALPVIRNDECMNMYRRAGFDEYIPDIFICAGKKEGETDSCEGDSGGPLVLRREDGRFVLAGIISWGIDCAKPNQPGVYVRVSHFRDWINQIIQF